MKNPSFKELSNISSSRYEICMMCAKRARRIVNGSDSLTKETEDKPVTQALYEIMEGKIRKDD